MHNQTRNGKFEKTKFCGEDDMSLVAMVFYICILSQNTSLTTFSKVTNWESIIKIKVTFIALDEFAL